MLHLFAIASYMLAESTSLICAAISFHEKKQMISESHLVCLALSP
jgi:hypothetical protein